ncbi:unnamed protein product [Phytophthora fragariaefolia]|uniref:Unnamed protein product n=1 Tax=Phytophthora fragariaefolia TaxID=1490495 RepID=A0A9W6XUW3_9STRA|nr:unnamed protein product [Phytophthora fragariaefolia]
MNSPSKPAWRSLCRPDQSGIVVEEDASDNEEVETEYRRYQPGSELPSTMEDVETISNLMFDLFAQIEGPVDLFQHHNEDTKTRIRGEYRHLFEHSASSSFFAYIPVYYWVEVLHQTNTAMRNYESDNHLNSRPLFTLQELMTFLGILLYMKLVDKGEYAHYWGPQLEDRLFGSSNIGLDNVMPLAGFKLLRESSRTTGLPSEQVFRSNTSGGMPTRSPESDATSDSTFRSRSRRPDPVARIRTHLNMMKITGGKYVELGRDVSLDEASVACRSKFGRNLIMFSPMKPGGKYHFRIYMLCCASTWIAVNFRIHCDSEVDDRLESVITPTEMRYLRADLGNLKAVRVQVIEVVRPLYYTNRVINADNYYMSVQLLAALRVKGLYGRGTVRGNSVHFPKHVVLQKSDCKRGTYRQGVSVDHQMVAAYWFDGAIVKMVSNADSSAGTEFTRRVGCRMKSFTAPTYVSKHRDPHRDFVTQLADELLSGKWMDAPSDRHMFYAASGADQSIISSVPAASWGYWSANC